MKRSHDMTVSGLLVLALVLPAGLAAAQDLPNPHAPTAGWDFPAGAVASNLPTTVNISYEGVDADADTGLPTHVRYLLRPGYAQNGTEINSAYRYNLYFDELVDFADPAWSAWMPFATDAQQRKITFPDLPVDEYFLLAVQTMDTTGAVSLGRRYGQEVFNFQTRDDSYFRPSLRVAEYFLGVTETTSYQSSIAAGQPLNFSWSASAEQYGGTIVSYRHGFDLWDPTDPNDPGWAVPPGLGEENRHAEETTFNDGVHRLTIRVEDDLGLVTLFNWTLQVIPFVSPQFQKPLCFIDQVVDDQTAMWPDPTGSIAYDHEDHRNAFWQFLQGAGGVADFNWEEDRFDHRQLVSYADLVWYRSVLISARAHTSQLMMGQFRPQDHQDRYVWLAPYQQRGGNLFLVGNRSLDSFLEMGLDYLAPVIFDSEEEYYTQGGNLYVAGFGQREMPDGTTVDRGPLMYPYATAGIAALDWSVPAGKYLYGSLEPGYSLRKAPCSGLKGLVLDSAFATRHGVGPGVLADTLLTEATIDWRDLAYPGSDSLDVAFNFTGDEFVDFNITDRPTAIVPQDCADGPDGMCVEPMFTGLSRFDWIKQRRWAEGNSDWPYDEYSPNRLDEICGAMSLTGEGDAALVTARVNGRTFGYLSYKNVEDKPSGTADVYWGFDPYRFDHERSRQAVRWVLEYFGLQLNR